MKSFLLVPIASLLFSLSVRGGEVASKPEVWMMPPSPDPSDGRVLRSLFTHPDEWKQARSKINVLGCADWVMNKQFTDAELRAGSR